jgi:hypothetical protein
MGAEIWPSSVAASHSLAPALGGEGTRRCTAVMPGVRRSVFFGRAATAVDVIMAWCNTILHLTVCTDQTLGKRVEARCPFDASDSSTGELASRLPHRAAMEIQVKRQPSYSSSSSSSSSSASPSSPSCDSILKYLSSYTLQRSTRSTRSAHGSRELVMRRLPLNRNPLW